MTGMQAQAAASRRDFLKLSLASGAVVMAVPGSVFAAAGGDWPLLTDGMTTPLVRIDPDNSITIFVPNPDMGQGTLTSVPMILAEEMDADWSRVRTEILPLRVKPNPDGSPGPAFVSQFTGGSMSIRNVWDPLRRYGAQARWLLVEAAARKWNVPAAGLQTRDSHVIDPKSGNKLAYGDLAALLPEIGYPSGEVALKKPADYRLIGSG